MDDLVAWLRVQVDADERGDGYAHCRGCCGGPEYIGTMYECDIDAARARVQREVESKRQIIDAYERAEEGAEFPTHEGGIAEGLERAVRLLALPYADQEGFREEWRP